MKRPLVRLIPLATAAATAILAQEFEVASVKPATPQRHLCRHARGGPARRTPIVFRT